MSPADERAHSHAAALESAAARGGSVVVRGPLWVALTFAAVAVALALVEPIIDDQGHMAYMFATAFPAEPLASLFFLKGHPAIGLLYAPFTGLGFLAYALAHALVGAAAVYLVGHLAERVAGRGWLASLVLAASPAFLCSAFAGQTHSDGVFLLALALVLYQRGSLGASLAAGLVLVLAPLARYDVAVVVAMVLAHALWRRRAAVLAAFFSGAVAYWLSGAAYHGALLWPLHFPPALPLPDADYHALSLDGSSLPPWLPLAEVTPLWLLPFSLRWRALPELARWLLVALGALFAALVVLPFTTVFNADFTPRILSLLLALMAPAVAWWTLGASRRLALVSSALATAGLAITVALRPADTAPLLLAALPLASPAIVLLGGAANQLRAMAALLALSLGLALVSPQSLLRSQAPTRGIRDAAELLRVDHPARPVYTNSQQLARLVERGGGPTRVFYLPGYDVLEELYRLLNARNGQYHSILRAIEHGLYGHAAWPCALATAGAPRDALFVLVPDFRLSVTFEDMPPAPTLDVVFPEGFWDARTEIVRAFPGVQVRAMRSGAVDFRPPLHEGGRISRAALEAACR